MDINKQAREAATNERQHQKRRESAMDARAKAETRQDIKTDSGLSESAREHATSQRQSREALDENIKKRAEEGI
jgi:hypothetical protein